MCARVSRFYNPFPRVSNAIKVLDFSYMHFMKNCITSKTHEIVLLRNKTILFKCFVPRVI